jgi:uncharacterized membrane protein YhaH (DUF805 family)
MNLNKQQMDYSYYYTIDGKQFGPYNLTQLIPEINGDTLVWREGIEWTSANNLEELKKFFPETNTFVEPNNTNPIHNDYTPVKQSMFKAPFSFDGRIRRTEYGISLIIYFISYFILLKLSYSVSIFGLAFIPLLWFFWAQGAKRCHDRGNSGWYQIIPFYIFWLLFAEGDLGENEYGSSPK